MSPCFVTGASGFIGSHLVKTLTDTGEEVIALVRDTVPLKWLDEALKDCVKVRGDILDYKILARAINQYEVDYVFHLAATASVKTAYRNPINTFETNVMGTVNVLEACRQIGVEKVLVLITDKIFGERMGAFETCPIEPSEPYATSKGAADLAAECYRKTYDMNIIRVRSCNVYGLDYSNRIVPNTIRACLRGESPVIFRGESETVRQYIHVQDLVEAMLNLMGRPDYKYGAFNVCTDDLLNQEDVVLKILEFFPNLKPTYVERNGPLEIKRQSMKLSSFGWKPKIPFEKGIEETISMFRKYGW